MENKKFQFDVIFTHQEEGGYTAEVPDLPGCISEGETIEQAEKNIQEAIDLYLETLEERGLPLPERDSKKVYKMQITVIKPPSKKANYA